MSTYLSKLASSCIATSVLFAFPALLTAQAVTDQPAPDASPPTAPITTAADADADTGAGEEVTVLPEFSVTAKQTNDYLPAEATTGTRVATKIQDLPFAVGVVTSEFLEDFAAIELIDQMNYTSGVSVAEIPGGGTYSARGIEAQVQLRNGFRRIGMIDSVTTDRVEVIKGANAGIYGPVTPGGVINTITKQPKTKRENNIKFRVGSNNLYRGEASSTGPLGTSGKLFYLVTLAGQMNNFDIEYKRQTQDVMSGNILWKITPRTSLALELEYIQRRDVGSYSGGTAAAIRQVSPDRYYAQLGTLTPRNTAQPTRTFNYTTGVATSVLDINTQGPNAIQQRSNKSATLSFNHRFNEIFSLRSALNGFDRFTERQEYGVMDYDPVSDAFSRNIQPVFRPISDGGVTFQADLLASWKTGSIKHKTLFTFDYQRITNSSRRYNSYYNNDMPTASRGTEENPGVRGAIVVPIVFPDGTVSTVSTTQYNFLAYGSTRDVWDWATSPDKTATYGVSGGSNIYSLGTRANSIPVGTRFTMPSGQTMVVRSDGTLGVPRGQMDYRLYSYNDYPGYYFTVQDSQAANDIYGIFLSERATLWNDRLNVFAGVRLDNQRTHTSDFLNRQDQEVWTSEPSYQLGLSLRLVPGVSVFVNDCRSFIPNNDPGAVDIFGNPFVPPNQIGKSWEVGVKLSLLDGAFNATLSHYDITLNNVSQDGFTDTGAAYTAVVGAQKSKGYEIDINWKPIDALQITANYAYNETEIEGNTSAPAFDGGPTRRAPRNTAGIAGKYTFAGKLKGLSVTAGFIYKDRMMPVSPGGRTISTGNGEIQNLRMANGLLIAPEFPENAIIPYLQKVPGTNQNYSFRVDDGRENLWNPSYALLQAGVRYQFKPTRKYTCSIQFNMTNILDREYLIGNYGVGEGRGWTMTYGLKF